MDDQNLVYADAVLIKMSKTIVAYAYRTVASHGNITPLPPVAICSLQLQPPPASASRRLLAVLKIAARRWHPLHSAVFGSRDLSIL